MYVNVVGWRLLTAADDINSSPDNMWGRGSPDYLGILTERGKSVISVTRKISSLKSELYLFEAYILLFTVDDDVDDDDDGTNNKGTWVFYVTVIAKWERKKASTIVRQIASLLLSSWRLLGSSLFNKPITVRDCISFPPCDSNNDRGERLAKFIWKLSGFTGHPNYWGTTLLCGPANSVGIATDYGLDGPGSNSGGDEIFRPSRLTLVPTQLPLTGTGSFPGVKCGRSVLLNAHPLLVPWSCKSRAIPLPTLWATTGL